MHVHFSHFTSLWERLVCRKQNPTLPRKTLQSQTLWNLKVTQPLACHRVSISHTNMKCWHHQLILTPSLSPQRYKHTHTTPKHTQPESPRRPLVDISFSKDDPLNKSWQLCHLSTKERLTSLTSAFSSWSDVRIWAVKKSEAALVSEILLNTSDSSFLKDLFPIKKAHTLNWSRFKDYILRYISPKRKKHL